MQLRYTLLTLILWLVAGAGSAAQAQDAPMEWGEVPRADLEMQTYPADTSATAVVLADYGDVRFNRRTLEVELERHTRIKILKEAGYDHATVEVPYYDENSLQDVNSVEGYTYTLSETGEVERSELDDDDIFEEDIDGNYRRVRFTLPALEPGAVIEYRYEKESKTPRFLPIWFFQNSAPTRHSEYRLRVPNFLNYVFLAQNVGEFDVRDSERRRNMMRYRWVMKDVPALREEPFMTTLEDFRAQMEIQLQSVKIPGRRTTRFMESWQAVADDLMDHDYFGDQISRHSEVRDRAEALTENVTDPEDKVRVLYDFVRENVRYNGKLGIFADRDLDDVLEARTGSSPEIALLLTSMLRDAGFEAHPVIISTRSNGKVQQAYPLVRQFNDVLVYTEAGETPRLLDATDPLRPVTLLPTSALGRNGLLVREEGNGGGIGWVQSPRGAPGLVRSVFVRGALDADGTLAGNLSVSDQAYSALSRRKSMREKENPEALVRDEILGGLSEVQIDSATVENADDVSVPVKTTVAFTAPNYAQAAADFLYVNPVLADRHDENPFQRPERSFPVDMIYPRDLRYVMLLTLPEGYAAQDLPESKRIRLSENSMFERRVSVKGRQLTLSTRLRMLDTTFGSDYYTALRDFFDRLVATQAEQIVLKRVPDAEVLEPVEAEDGETPGAEDEAAGTEEAASSIEGK